MKNSLRKLALFLSLVVTFSLLQAVAANAGFQFNNTVGPLGAITFQTDGYSRNIKILNAPTAPSGKLFAGWSTNPGSSGSGSIVGLGGDNISYSGVIYQLGQTVFQPYERVELYATWTDPKDVIFQAGAGGGTVPSTMTVPAGTSITLPDASGLTNPGSCFDGWKHTYDPRSTSTYNQVFAPGETFNNIAHYVYFTAQWRLGDCPVSYDDNGSTGGSAPSSTTVTQGATYTLESNPGNLVKPGYRLLGWSTTATGSVLSTKVIAYTTNVFYARWAANNTYSINFRCSFRNLARDCTGTQAASSWNQGDSATVLPATTTFSRPGYSFDGWIIKQPPRMETSTTYAYSTAANANFDANWFRNSYSVTFDKNSDTATGTMAIETRSADTVLPANTFTWDANNTFQGWNTEADGSGTAYANRQRYAYIVSTTLYAQWGKTISYSSAGADSGTPSRSSDSWRSGAISLPTAGTMVKAGYSFGGWSDGSTTYTTSYTPTTGITLNPVWTPFTYTIKFNKNGVTSSGAVPADQTWDESTTALTLSGNTGSLVRAGYDFGGWATSASAPQSAVTTFSSTSDTLTQTLYAIWTPISYSVTYALNSGTSSLPTETNKNIYDTFNVAAAPTRAGYIFGGWSDGTSIYSAASTYTVASSSITLTAEWIPLYTVHYVMNGSLTTPDADTTTALGTIVALAAAPTRTGYTFTGWVDNLPTPVVHAAGSNFTVIQDSTLQARWTAIPITVTYSLASGTSTLPTQASVNINNSFTIAATPTRPGYTFTGWSDGTNTYGAGATYVVGSSNVVLTAQWSAISYSVIYDLAGGSGTRPTKSNVNIGNTFIVSTIADPSWLAHTFVGWSDGTTSYAKTDTYTVGSSNIVLTAVWRQNGYTQITYALGGGSGTLPTQAALIEGSEFTLASGSALSKTSLAFAGWSDGIDTFTAGTSYFAGPEWSPITLTAAWDVASDPTPAPPAPGASTPDPVVVKVVEKPKESVVIVTRITKSTESPVVEAGIKAISDSKKFDSFFKVPTPPATTGTSPTTPVVAPITAANIVVVNANTSVNSQTVNTTSNKPVTVPISLTNPIFTDEAAKVLSSKVIVETDATNIKITAVGGFTGVVIVPVIATFEGVQTTVLNRVVVSPVLSGAKTFTPIDIGRSSITWKASPSQVVSYEVAVNGKVACTTTTTTCPLSAFLGPNTKITVNAIGNDETKSGPQIVRYLAVKPVPALTVNFNIGSAVLTSAQKKEISAITKVIGAQGFTRIVVNGFTDASGSQAANTVLSKARAETVAIYVKSKLPGVSVKAGAKGAAKTIANNTIDNGRAQDRRTEIATW